MLFSLNKSISKQIPGITGIPVEIALYGKDDDKNALPYWLNLATKEANNSVKNG
jgi:hypothetical protein